MASREISPRQRQVMAVLAVCGRWSRAIEMENKFFSWDIDATLRILMDLERKGLVIRNSPALKCDAAQFALTAKGRQEEASYVEGPVVAVKTPKPKKVTVDDIRAVMDSLAAHDGSRRARRTAEGVPARYIDNGKPDCLAAVVLHCLGASTGVLRALDREGGSRGAGVVLRTTGHPWRRRFTPLAWELLCFLQRCNDEGDSWEEARQEAFIGVRHYWDRDTTLARMQQHRPWLTYKNALPVPEKWISCRR